MRAYNSAIWILFAVDTFPAFLRFSKIFFLQSVHFLRAYDPAIWVHFAVGLFPLCKRFFNINTFCCRFISCVLMIQPYDYILHSIHFLRAYDSAIWILLQLIHFLLAYDSAIWILLLSIHLMLAYYSAIWIHFAVNSISLVLWFSHINTFCNQLISFVLTIQQYECIWKSIYFFRVNDYSIWTQFAVDSFPACSWFSHILHSIHFLRAFDKAIWIRRWKIWICFEFDSLTSCVRFSHMNTYCCRFICCLGTIQPYEYILQSIHFLWSSDSAIWIHLHLIRLLRAYDSEYEYFCSRLVFCFPLILPYENFCSQFISCVRMTQRCEYILPSIHFLRAYDSFIWIL